MIYSDVFVVIFINLSFIIVIFERAALLGNSKSGHLESVEATIELNLANTNDSVRGAL